MSGRTRLLFAVLGGLAVVALLVGIAITTQREQVARPPEQQTSDRWPAGERAAFVNTCVKSCRASPGVTPVRYPVCDQACKCAADEGEKIVAGRELADIVAALQNGKATTEQNDKMERMKAAGVACAAPNANDKK